MAAVLNNVVVMKVVVGWSGFGCCCFCCCCDTITAPVIGRAHVNCRLVLPGSPRPRVSWRAGTRLLDAKTERDGGDLDATTNSPEAAPLTLAPARRTQHQPKEEDPHSTLTLGPLRRHHLHLVLTCEATNNNITSPVSLAIAVDMSREYKPLTATSCPLISSIFVFLHLFLLLLHIILLSPIPSTSLPP